MALRRLIFILITHLCATLVVGQSRLQFCVQANDKGECIKPAQIFEVEASGGTISFLITDLLFENITKIRYKIFYIRENEDEDLLIGIDQKTQSDWQFAWQDVVLFDPGKYKVKVYHLDENQNESFLCLNTLSIVVAK